MMWNVALYRQMIFEGTVSADSEEEAVEIAMERNSRDDFNWRRNGPTQVVCVEPAYDGLGPYGMVTTGSETPVDPQEWPDDDEWIEWALD